MDQNVNTDYVILFCLELQFAKYCICFHYMCFLTLYFVIQRGCNIMIIIYLLIYTWKTSAFSFGEYPFPEMTVSSELVDLSINQVGPPTWECCMATTPYRLLRVDQHPRQHGYFTSRHLYVDTYFCLATPYVLVDSFTYQTLNLCLPFCSSLLRGKAVYR